MHKIKCISIYKNKIENKIDIEKNNINKLEQTIDNCKTMSSDGLHP